MLISGPTDAEKAAISAHFEHLEAQAEKGVVLLAGRTMGTAERTFGIVIFAAESQAEAEEFARKDPAIALGVMNYELFHYRVAVHSKNWIGES